MWSSPLTAEVLFRLGPLEVTLPVVTSWGIILVLGGGSWLAVRRFEPSGGPVQAALEILVETLEQELRAITRRDPWPFLPLIGALFLFLLTANLCGVLPGVSPPTAAIETPAALALVVFASAQVAGVRARGLAGYLKGFLEPNPLLLPLNLLGEFTRTFSLMIRLFGNMMSHEFVGAIVLLLAGFLVPVPFQLLAILIGAIQAYIFTVLAAVFIAAASETSERKPS